MHKIDIVRAWKDPLYRASLSPEQLAQLPDNPAGVITLSDEQLLTASGGATYTEYTYNHIRACCPTF